jgi:non-homologous end joining protein Ku
MTLRYAHEVRSEVDYFENIPNMTLPKDMLQLAEHILETKTEDFDPAYLEDRYRSVLVEKLREKHAKMPMKRAASAPSRQNVISLMDALKRSLSVERPRRSIQKTGSTPTAAGGRTARSSKKLPARPGRAAKLKGS